ncbi:hypothetical protein [Halapricum desulfuricans]|uniref:Uncharacterized protein n=1 Tax=Halapricum desulfuricans TaxID=2841257 RepID=A0A897N561_9EURY|nr:hypothetical protein [Halapricum desulfuricans]QSG07388.1 Uncharacterized protein HSR121_3078 [Halapricum desulfuricans]
MSDAFPEIASDGFEDSDWEQRARTESTVFNTPTASIVGHTVLYGDATLRTALGDARGSLSDGDDSADRMIDTGDGGGFWRFFFATALSFRPPLAPGLGTASMRPTVVSEARRSFEDDMRARGFEDVDRGRGQRARTRSGERVSLTKLTARHPLEDGPIDALDIEGWLGVWSTGGSFRIAGGCYPIGGLETLLDPADGEHPVTDPSEYRDELLELIRSVR